MFPATKRHVEWLGGGPQMDAGVTGVPGPTPRFYRYWHDPAVGVSEPSVALPGAPSSATTESLISERCSDDPAAHLAEITSMQRTVTFYERFTKRIFDVIVGTMLLLVAAPLMLIVALAVRVTLGPGVLFRHKRVGRNGCTFTVYKFRTMNPDRRVTQLPFDGPADRRFTHKHPQDPRLTRLGRFLRRWSLDELPQLLNVVRGDMSLVGPRPELVAIVNGYSPWQHARHAVTPGMTGLWQVAARGSGLMHQNTHIDLDYVRKVRFSTDLLILLLTIPALLGARRGH